MPLLFFGGGAPRSGTTWLQQILNAHPDISCMGEGLFERHLAGPIDRMMAEWAGGLTAKNTKLFQHTGGYPIPDVHPARPVPRPASLSVRKRRRTCSSSSACIGCFRRPASSPSLAIRVMCSPLPGISSTDPLPAKTK